MALPTIAFRNADQEPVVIIATRIERVGSGRTTGRSLLFLKKPTCSVDAFSVSGVSVHKSNSRNLCVICEVSIRTHREVETDRTNSRLSLTPAVHLTDAVGLPSIAALLPI